MELSKLTYKPFDFEDRKVSVQPELMISFLQNKKKELIPGRLWLAMKFLDKQGAGILTTEYVKSAFCGIKDGYLHIMTWNSLKPILERFNGRFWTYANDRIVLHSPAKVANYFNLPQFGYNSIWIRHDDIFVGKQRFAAACYGAYVTTLGDILTSRNKICKRLNISKTQQIRYEKLLLIDTKAAAVIVDHKNKYDTTSPEYQKYRREHGQNLTPVTTGRGEIIYAKRIGNIRKIGRMIKTTGGRRRRKLNEKIDRVERGGRNQASEVEAFTLVNGHFIMKHIKNTQGKIYHTVNDYLKGTVKKALSFKYVYSNHYGVKRVGTHEMIPCLLFFQGK